MSPYVGNYFGNDNSGKPKADYIKQLSEMDDEQLFKACEQYIWLSSYAVNNRNSDYHWKCDACWDECVKRGQAGKGGIYDRAWHKAAGKYDEACYKASQ